MERPTHSLQACRLSKLVRMVRAVVSTTFPELVWVIAEIADYTRNQKGHCYLDLIEREETRTIAQMRATIWSDECCVIEQKFESASGSPLRPGLQILFLATLSFHEVYGLRLNIKDIDPAYTLGEMALVRRETMARLAREGLIDLNRSLLLPLVPQRVAVISSPNAAGYSDFCHQLTMNRYGYRFSHRLFPAMMQGPGAGQSIIAAFASVAKTKKLYDIVALVRGGGSVEDLSCFDGYDLAAAIARFPLPVVTGIGHEKNDTIADAVAYTKLKTPTAVAEFIIAGVRVFDERVERLAQQLRLGANLACRDSLLSLTAIARRLRVSPMRRVTEARKRTHTLAAELRGFSRNGLTVAVRHLIRLEQAVRYLDPAAVLRRGYSITRAGGTIVKDSMAVAESTTIETTLAHGTLQSVVTRRTDEPH